MILTYILIFFFIIVFFGFMVSMLYFSKYKRRGGGCCADDVESNGNTLSCLTCPEKEDKTTINRQIEEINQIEVN